MRSNRVPMTDVCDLITQISLEGPDGYRTISETTNTVFCSIADGVSRAEFYEAAKAGVQLNATAEVWEDDYNAEKFLEHEGKRYSIERVYPTGSGLLQLSLKEVIRG